MTVTSSKHHRRSSRLEKFAWFIGCALLLSYGAVRWHYHESVDAGVRAFMNAKQIRVSAPTAPVERDGGRDKLPFDAAVVDREALSFPAQPDMRNWSASRKTAYESESAVLPEGVLGIEALNLVVPVYNGTSEQNLNRGVAWIENTAALGSLGNVGLAAHRDGYFRALGDIGPGDRITLETLDARVDYVVDRTRIVKPTAVEVLAPSEEGMLTLVTCYPFYFVGPAPERFIVHARVATEQAALAADETARSLGNASTPQLAP